MKWSAKTLVASNAVGTFGLAFVPDIVRSYSSPSEAFEALKASARKGEIELRPESGLGRLSAEELALCVPGPIDSGSVLSYARVLE